MTKQAGNPWRTGLGIIALLVCTAAHASEQPSPASIYAALQSQRNTCQDQAALSSAASNEQVAKLQAELASLKKDFGVEDK